MVVCFIPGCKSGNSSKEKTHLFKISKNATSEVRSTWLINIPKRQGMEFDFNKSEVCFKHFEERFLIKTKKVMMGSVIMKEEPRSRWTLTEDAIPTIFSNDKVPKYFDRPRTRPPPKPRLPLKTYATIKSLTVNNDTDCAAEAGDDMTSLTDIDLFKSLQEDGNKIQLQQCWFYESNVDRLVYFKLVKDEKEKLTTFHAERTVIIGSNLVPEVIIRRKSVQLAGLDEVITSSERLTLLLQKVDQLRICEGIRNHNMAKDSHLAYRCGNSWISNNCETTVDDPSICKQCAEVRPQIEKNIHQELYRFKHQREKVVRNRRKFSTYARAVRRMKGQLNSSRASLKILQRQFLNIEKSKLEDAIQTENNIPPQMKSSLLAAANLAKAKSKHGVRYQADWILQSLLLKICSPKAYRHLRDNNVLPLPHPLHLTSLLRGLPCQFGFNDFVFKCLEKEFANRPKKDRQLMLIFDEMKIRENISYDKSTMRFSGYIDYGDFTNDNKKITKSRRLEADHALVFMCRSVNSKLTQPIAYFATKGAAPGNVLAKMIISCICKLESIKGEVIGVISDGATSNKSAWKALGIGVESGSIRNKIPNPCDPSRDVRFLCDFPHVMKCVRNHVHNRGCVQFEGKLVNWGFYQALYDLDSSHDVRVAYKLTNQHINPNPFQKMKVSYATQIFSKSVADALLFYREIEKSHFLKHSEGTENFTRKMNELFDACNAKIPNEGVRKGSIKYQVIQNFLRNLKKEDNFASAVTMNSIKITLTSTLELIDYLCDKMEFNYVLTVKFNQDCLENFFGLLRSYGGDDCHPTATSFSHLFRLMSIYMPTLKSIKGNASNDDEYSVVNYVDSLKALKKSAEVHNSKIKEDLDERIVSKIIYGEEECNDISSQPSSVQSIVYNLCGFLVRKAKSFTKCMDCLQSLKGEASDSSYSLLTQIKDLGGLKYPSKSLFNLIVNHVEPKIVEFLSVEESRLSASVVSDIASNLDEINCTGVGCSSEHCSGLVSSLIIFYITIRMYFYAKNQNTDKLRSNTETKKKMKEAKLS